MPIIKTAVRYEGIAVLRRRPIKFRRLNVDFRAVYRLTVLPLAWSLSLSLFLGSAATRQLKYGADVTTRNIAAFHRSVCRWDSYRQFARTRTIAAEYNNYNGLAVAALLALSLAFPLASTISNAPWWRRDTGEQRIVRVSIIRRTKLCHRKMFIGRIKRQLLLLLLHWRKSIHFALNLNENIQKTETDAFIFLYRFKVVF